MTEEKLPNFAAVTLDEAVEHADAFLSSTGHFLKDWVEAENARREQAQLEYEAQPVEIAGVTLSPGDVAHLSIKDRYSKAPKRKLNCLIERQEVSHTYNGRQHRLRFRAYGAKPGGYAREDSIYSNVIVKVEKVPTPDWITADIAERAERMKTRGY